VANVSLASRANVLGASRRIAFSKAVPQVAAASSDRITASDFLGKTAFSEHSRSATASSSNVASNREPASSPFASPNSRNTRLVADRIFIVTSSPTTGFALSSFDDPSPPFATTEPNRPISPGPAAKIFRPSALTTPLVDSDPKRPSSSSPTPVVDHVAPRHVHVPGVAETAVVVETVVDIR
jgi:hypothetical protein